MAIPAKIGNYRWTILALLFFATTINYVDRNTISFIMLDDVFKAEMLGLPANTKLTTEQNAEFVGLYGKVDAVFKGAYAFGFILMGTIIDKIGVRLGYAISILIWALSAISHSLVGNISGLRIARFFLGIGESGNFPAAIKTVAVWFPKKERSLATGIFNAGANIGMITVAFAVPFLVIQFGWRATFICTSSLGFVLLTLWLIFYKHPNEHKGVTQAELDHINSDKEIVTEKKIGWATILPFRQTWAFGIGKFLTDMIWFFYLTLLPNFFNTNKRFELDLKHIGWPFLVIYLVSDGGSVAFGWVSSNLMKRGWTANAARKTTMLVCALCVVPVLWVSQTDSIVVAVSLIALAAAAHQGWSANLFTTATDMFPKQAMGSVVGFGGMMGAIGGMILAFNYKILLGPTLNYTPLFIISASAYLTALLIIHLLAPKLEPVKIDLGESS